MFLYNNLSVSIFTSNEYRKIWIHGNKTTKSYSGTHCHTCTRYTPTLIWEVNFGQQQKCLQNSHICIKTTHQIQKLSIKWQLRLLWVSFLYSKKSQETRKDIREQLKSLTTMLIYIMQHRTIDSTLREQRLLQRKNSDRKTERQGDTNIHPLVENSVYLVGCLLSSSDNKNQQNCG